MGIPDKRHPDLIGATKEDSKFAFAGSTLITLAGTTVITASFAMGCKLDSLVPTIVGLLFGLPVLAIGVGTLSAAWRIRKEAKITESMNQFSDE